jgi:hypothetical protein
MRTLPSIFLGLMLSCGAMQAANAADCSTQKEFLTMAEVSKTTGLTLTTAQDAGQGCMYMSTPDSSGMANQVQLGRLAVPAKQTYDATLKMMAQSQIQCEKLAGVGDEASLCTLPASAMQVTVVAIKGDRFFTVVVAAPAAMTDKAVAAKLPAAAKALTLAMIAK